MRRLLVATAALVAAVAVLVAFTLPPRRLALPSAADGTIAGVLHVHTNRSDGLSGPDDIARAAARAGLTFVVFTDHGDATRPPEPPAYRSGVLCLDGVEISTTGGHYVAIDMPPAPYPLGGEPRDVVEDVHRLGGFGIAAHPESPKVELKWREWSAPIDAIELLNPDSAWRAWTARTRAAELRRTERLRTLGFLATTLVDYTFRPVESATRMLTTEDREPFRWAALAERRRVVTVAGVDAHARLPLRNTDVGETRLVLPLPGYEPSFRLVSVHLRTDRPLTGNATDDAALVVTALRAGHAFTAIDGVATPASLEVQASNASGTARMGDELRVAGPVTLRVRTNAPPTFTTTVWDGTKAVSGGHHEAAFAVTVPAGPATYWVEIRSTGRTPELPWVRSNAIYVRPPEPLTRPLQHPPATRSVPLFDGASPAGWRVEQEPSSGGDVSLEQDALRFKYALSTQITPAPVVALVRDTASGIAPSDRLAFTARADRPMRISVQLRLPLPDGGAERWQRSVYLAPQEEERTVYVDELMPIGATRTWKPPAEAVRSILFVVDPVNTKRGSSGRIWLKNVRLQQ